MAGKSNVFTCRVCGSHEFGQAGWVDRNIGRFSHGKLYSCTNCSTVFQSPENFSSTPYKELKGSDLNDPLESSRSPLSGPCSGP